MTAYPGTSAESCQGPPLKWGRQPSDQGGRKTPPREEHFVIQSLQDLGEDLMCNSESPLGLDCHMETYSKKSQIYPPILPDSFIRSAGSDRRDMPGP